MSKIGSILDSVDDWTHEDIPCEGCARHTGGGVFECDDMDGLRQCWRPIGCMLVWDEVEV